MPVLHDKGHHKGEDVQGGKEVSSKAVDLLGIGVAWDAQPSAEYHRFRWLVEWARERKEEAGDAEHDLLLRETSVVPRLGSARLESPQEERVLSEEYGLVWPKKQCCWNHKARSELGSDEEDWDQN